MISKKLVIQNYAIEKLYPVCSLTDIADIANHEPYFFETFLTLISQLFTLHSVEFHFTWNTSVWVKDSGSSPKGEVEVSVHCSVSDLPCRRSGWQGDFSCPVFCSATGSPRWAPPPERLRPWSSPSSCRVSRYPQSRTCPPCSGIWFDFLHF